MDALPAQQSLDRFAQPAVACATGGVARLRLDSAGEHTGFRSQLLDDTDDGVSVADIGMVGRRRVGKVHDLVQFDTCDRPPRVACFGGIEEPQVRPAVAVEVSHEMPAPLVTKAI